MACTSLAAAMAANCSGIRERVGSAGDGNRELGGMQ